MAWFKKKEAAEALRKADLKAPKKAKRQSRKERKMGDVWTYYVKWGREIEDKQFNSLTSLMNELASDSDYLATHQMNDVVVVFKQNQDEHVDFAKELALPLQKSIEEELILFDSKEHKPFAHSLVTDGPGYLQSEKRNAEERDAVSEQETEVQKTFFEQERAPKAPENNEVEELVETEKTEQDSTDWGDFLKGAQPDSDQTQVTRPYPPVRPNAIQETKVEDTETVVSPVEEVADEAVTIQVAAKTEGEIRPMSAEDSVLDSLIKAQMQLSKELDIDKEAILKEELEATATTALKKAQAEATVSSKINLEKAKRDEIARHKKAMEDLEAAATEDLKNEKEALNKRFSEDAAKDFEEKRRMVQEKHQALLEKKEELDQQIEAFKELLS